MADRLQACPIGAKPTGPRPWSNFCTLSVVALTAIAETTCGHRGDEGKQSEASIVSSHRNAAPAPLTW